MSLATGWGFGCKRFLLLLALRTNFCSRATILTRPKMEKSCIDEMLSTQATGLLLVEKRAPYTYGALPVVLHAMIPAKYRRVEFVLPEICFS